MGFGGGQVDITNGKFVFSCTEAYRVQNGQVGAPIKGATLNRGRRNGIETYPRPWKRYGIGPWHGHMRKIGAMGSRWGWTALCFDWWANCWRVWRRALILR